MKTDLFQLVWPVTRRFNKDKNRNIVCQYEFIGFLSKKSLTKVKNDPVVRERFSKKRCAFHWKCWQFEVFQFKETVVFKKSSITRPIFPEPLYFSSLCKQAANIEKSSTFTWSFSIYLVTNEGCTGSKVNFLLWTVIDYLQFYDSSSDVCWYD